MQNPRNVALKILYNIDVCGAYINIEIKNTLDKCELKSIDKKLVTELVHGVIKYKLRLDYIINQFSKVKMKKISPYVLNILRLGIYQIIFLDKIPDRAAINESVNLVKKYSPHSAGFVNAILRNVTRTEIKYPDDKIEYLSVYYSFEKWMLKKFIDEYGIQKAESLLNSLNKKKELYIRVNMLKTSVDKLIDDLSKNGIYAEKSDVLPDALKVDNLSGLSSLDLFENGHFYVQDLSSMMAAYALSPKENDFVIDVCAAPGGKTSYIAELMNNKGRIIAFDMYEHKLKLMQENFKKLGIDIIETSLNNSEKLNESYIEKADCVLVDAPCSGLGIISKKPDIKYSVKEVDIISLAKQSFEILCTSSKYVKKGGTLVYSLCTFTKEEGKDNVEKFLQFDERFELDSIKCYNKENNGMITLLPDEFDADGFFICRFKRK
jgi:16S rRNA (cytosine967-C5)-methyltransferase